MLPYHRIFLSITASFCPFVFVKTICTPLFWRIEIKVPFFWAFCSSSSFLVSINIFTPSLIFFEAKNEKSVTSVFERYGAQITILLLASEISFIKCFFAVSKSFKPESFSDYFNSVLLNCSFISNSIN